MANELRTLLSEHADDIDAIAAEFESGLGRVIDAAMKDVRAELGRRLEVENGVVVGSAANQQTLADLDDMLMRRMVANGYNDILQRYTDSFNGQYVAFDDVLKHINSQLEWPLPQPKFDGAVRSELEAQKVTARTLIDDAVRTAATSAKRAALVSVGAVNPVELAESIASQLGKSIGQAESLADTGISSFYRSISDKGFRIIEDELPGFKVRYTYDGPLDVLNRPFCAKLQRQANSGKSWTRAQIDKMDNKQLPNVWMTAGGYRCRHQWVIDTRDLRQQQSGKPRPEPKSVKSSDEFRRKIKATRVLSRDKIKRSDKAAGKAASARKQAQAKVKERRAKSNR